MGNIYSNPCKLIGEQPANFSRTDCYNFQLNSPHSIQEGVFNLLSISNYCRCFIYVMVDRFETMH